MVAYRRTNSNRFVIDRSDQLPDGIGCCPRNAIRQTEFVALYLSCSAAGCVAVRPKQLQS